MNTMILRKLIILLLVAGNTLMAQKNEFSLTGKTSDIEDGTYLYFRDLANGGNIDSAMVRNNTFEFSTDLPEPVLFVMLFTKDKTKATELWLENDHMTFDATKNDFKNAEVTGSRNHLLASVVKNVVYADAGEVSDEIKIQREKAFLNEHQDAVISAYVLTMAKRRMTQSEVAKFFSKLDPEVQHSSIGRKVAKFLEWDIAEIGDEYTDLTASSFEGKTVQISDLMGKLTLLQFWSSSCGFSRKMNTEILTKIYPKYRQEGLEIITISDDKSKEVWKRTVQEDKFNWPQLNNLISENEDLFRAYGVYSTPSNFLINNQGEIVARNLAEDDLEQKIRELLNM